MTLWLLMRCHQRVMTKKRPIGATGGSCLYYYTYLRKLLDLLFVNHLVTLLDSPHSCAQGVLLTEKERNYKEVPLRLYSLDNLLVCPVGIINGEDKKKNKT